MVISPTYTSTLARQEHHGAVCAHAATRRRLGQLTVHLMAPHTAAGHELESAESTTVVPDDEKWVRPQHELHSVQPLPAPDPELMRQLSLGKLNVAELPLDTVRSMMRPEPDQPSETEANMSGFMP